MQKVKQLFGKFFRFSKRLLKAGRRFARETRQDFVFVTSAWIYTKAQSIALKSAKRKERALADKVFYLWGPYLGEDTPTPTTTRRAPAVRVGGAAERLTSVGEPRPMRSRTTVLPDPRMMVPLVPPAGGTPKSSTEHPAPRIVVVRPNPGGEQ